MKTWKPWPGIDCPDCGNRTEVESNPDAADGCCHDGDRLRCADPDCPRHTADLGSVAVWDVDAVSESFEAWPIGEDDRPYNPAEIPLSSPLTPA